jgi:hypothetical protein
MLTQMLGLGISWLALPPARAQGLRFAAENQIKAAYLFKFLTFTEWPPQAFGTPEAPLEIGVLASAALAQELLQTVAGRTVNGRGVLVRELGEGGTTAGLHVLFIGRAATRRAAQLIAATRGQPLLTVGEAEDGMPTGIAINFVVIDDKVRFDIAPVAAEAAGLRISSRLLGVARKVHMGQS